MNDFMANPTLATSVLYYAAGLLNFLAALWMATCIARLRGTDLWLFRFLIMLAGIVYVIITISMIKNIEYAPHASSLVWWWAIAVLGVLAILHTAAGMIPEKVMRGASYVGAVLAYWGAYLVFTEQDSFAELGTYYGFFGANLTAATWMILTALRNSEILPHKRALILGAGMIYATLVVSAFMTMQMILETPYDF